MSGLSELQAAVEAQGTVVESAIALINGLADKIAGLTLDQAAIDALAAEVRGDAANLAAAVEAGTTPTPTPEA